MATHKKRGVAKQSATIAIAGVLTLGMLAPLTGVANAAEAYTPEIANSSLGLPTFKGVADPIPAVNGLTTNTINPGDSYLQKVFEQDKKNGAGTDTEHDFWIDRMLTRTGNSPQRVSGASGFQGPYGWESSVSQGEDANGNKYSYNNPDGNGYLFTRGRAAFMYTYNPGDMGFSGNLAYWDVTGKHGYDITVTADGAKQKLTEDPSQRKQTPSYWKGVYQTSGKTLKVTVVKYITNNNVLVSNITVESTKDRDVTIDAIAPLATAATADGSELTGRFAAKNNLTTVYPRFSGNGFKAADGKLTQTLSVKANAPQTTKLQLGLVTEEIPESRTEYDAIRTGDRQDPAASYTKHVTEYNQWWVDNIPYIETPEHNIDKTLFYRWWLSRFNYLDANIPGGPMSFPTSIEGVLGYNNAIDLTVGMFIDDLKWMRNAEYSYGPWLNMGENARDNGQYRDSQADPTNWGASHTQWISEAAWKSYQIHGGDADVAQKLADYAYGDTKGQIKNLDSDGDYLLDTNWNAWTGNDADAVSFTEVSGARLDRAESATVYAGAKAAAEAYREAGGEANEKKAQEMDEYAAKIKESVLTNLWDSDDKLIRHQFANGSKKGQQAKYKEINNFTPYFTDLMPAEGDADYKDDYEDALRLLGDAAQHPVFPFATANQADDKLAREEAGAKPTNNFSIINSTLYFRAYSEAIRKYHAADKGYVTPENFKQLLYWNAFAHYQGGDNQLTDQNEFWNNASTKNGGSIKYRSWIHHTQLGTTNWAVIEDVAGVRTRTDNKLELYPIAIPGWNHFIVNNLSYHGQNLTVVWNGDGHYTTAPKGYSAYIGGKLAFTSDKLAHLLYDPATGDVTVQDDSGAKVTDNATSTLPDAKGVTYKATDRVAQVLAKAGVNAVNDNGADPAVNVAKGATATATFQANDNNRAAKNATDGTTSNIAFWSTKGTPNKSDTITVDLGKEQTVNDVRLYFYKSSTSATTGGYAEPQMYTVEYLDKDGKWQPVADQARTPATPQGNLNRVQFKAVPTSKLRVTVTPQPGQAVGLKEIEAYNTAEKATATGNAAPSVDAYEAGRSVGKVEIAGVVKDDGQPKGELSTEWSVVSAPKDGKATFADAKALNTTVKFSKAGQYVLRLSASDGDKTGTSDVVVTADEYTGEFNIAPEASKVSASHTNGYLPSGNVKVINDGKVSYDGASPNDSWNNYGDNFSNGVDGSAYVQYKWSAAVPLTKAQMFLWADNSGVPTTKSWKMQYLDQDGKTWKDIALKDGAKYGVAQNRGNVVEFAEPVVTTAVRAVFAKNAVVGVSEFEVYAKDPLGVDVPEVATSTNKQPTMPKTVSAYYADGSRLDLPVTWNKIADSDLASDGELTVTGKTFGTSLDITAKVYVRSSPGSTLNATVPLEQTVYVGAKALALPATIPGVYNSGDNHNIPVKWDDASVKAVDLNKAGDYVVTGTATDDLGSNGTAEAKITVHVVDPNAEPAPSPEPSVDSVAISGDGVADGRLALAEGDSVALSAEVKVTGDAAKTVSWKSSDDAVATVSDKGEVKAVKAGKATITATSTVDASKKASIEVTVTAKEPEPTPDTAAPVFAGVSDVAVDFGASFDPLAGVSAKDAVDGDVTGSIKVGGAVDTSKAGVYTLTYTVADKAGNTATATRKVTVREQKPEPKPTVASIAVTKKPAKAEYQVGEQLDTKGLEVTATLSDGKTRVLDASEYGLAGFDSSKPGVVTVTVSLKADPKVAAAFEVTVKAKEPQPEPGPDDKAAFTDVDDKTPHKADIDWLAEHKVSEGWDNGDGTRSFGPMRTVVRQDMAAFLYRLAGSPSFDESKVVNPFTDVDKSTPHYKEILWLYSTGISRGYAAADGSLTFGGMRTVVRQDMAAFLHRLAEYKGADVAPGDSGAFPDVTKDTPHAEDIAWLAGADVADGYEDGSFGGMRDVVRQDMAAFLHRMDANVLSK